MEWLFACKSASSCVQSNLPPYLFDNDDFSRCQNILVTESLVQVKSHFFPPSGVRWTDVSGNKGEAGQELSLLIPISPFCSVHLPPSLTSSSPSLTLASKAGS